MRNIVLILKYEGSAYHGWQIQKNAVSVAQMVEKAVGMVTGAPAHVTGCGRTDAGVHAKHYVANFRTESLIPVDRLPYALNTHLPDDIVVSEAFETHPDFNAIGSCVRKEYTYLIYNSRIRDPFYVNRAWFYPKHLDEGIMRRAAECFVGTHDFAAVRSVGTDVKSTVRTVYHFQIDREGDLIFCRICANGFLYNMVRIFVGTLLDINEGIYSPDAIPEILAARDRLAAGRTAMAHGLYLNRVFYDDAEIHGF